MSHEHCAADIETYSAAPLKKCGAYKYAEDPSTEVLCLFYSFVQFGVPGPVHGWVPDADIPEEVILGALARVDEDGNPIITGELHVGPIPDDLREWAEEGKEFRAHNAEFEFVNLNGPPGQKIGFPPTPNEQWVCTAAKVSAHSLPRALGFAAEAANTHRKDEDGKMDMMAVTKPRTGKIPRWTPENSPDRFIKLYSYCADDVKAEMGLDEYVPDISPREQKVWEMCRKINDRGVRVDMPAVGNVQELIRQYKEVLERKCHQICGLKPTQTGKIADWIRGQGYHMENLQAPTIDVALKDPKIPKKVKTILKIRRYHSMKAVTKYNAIEAAVCADGRLHGMFMYHGAGTGRWSGRLVQLQNLFRPVINDPDLAIEAYQILDLEWIAALWDQNPMKVFASTVRGMLIPSEDHDFAVFDFNSIEACVTPWLAGQTDVLDVIESGKELYKYAAARIYSVDYDDVTSDQRFIGKIAILALGYQGGYRAFAKMAKAYGVEISREFAQQIVDDWRVANKKIVKFWYAIEEAAIAAVANPGSIYKVGNGKIMFKIEGDWLYMRLPSGRRLAYYKPQLDSDGKVTYMGIDTYTRRYMRVNTYGGKLTENAVQAIARDLLVCAMFALEKAGFKIVAHVHDEVILEILETLAGGGNGTKEAYWGVMLEIYKLMVIKPDWYDGPLDARDGFRAKRFRK